MNEILVTVNEDGSINVKTTGFSGPSCLEETKRLLNYLEEEAGVEIKSEIVECEETCLVREQVRGGAKVGV